MAPNDIVIGHPDANPHSIMSRLLKHACRARILLWPFHSTIPEVNRYVLPIAPYADALMMISGPYWTDTISSTEYALWGPKILRLDNSIDLQKFPTRKSSFHAKGSRGLFAYGRSGKGKRARELFSLLLKTEYPVLVAGNYSQEDLSLLKDRPNTQFLGWINLQDQKVIQFIIKMCDFYIAIPDSDPSPTTLLESMAIGLIPIVTKQCGYDYDSFIKLSGNDPLHDLNVLSMCQTMKEMELFQRQEMNWKILKEIHSWPRFQSMLWEAVVRIMFQPSFMHLSPSIG